jgi:hypothetical protein
MGPYRTHSKRYAIPSCYYYYQLIDSFSIVYSVVLDPARNQACSGSMDGTVRVWNLQTGTAQHVLQGHTSLVGLLGLSPSHLVSAAADSTLRIWDPDTGELKHTLAAHTGAITCFQHDEFKVLSGSDGNLKMWNVKDGTVVRDLLTGITGVWQVVFEGRWCVAASNRADATVLDVWDFGYEGDGKDEEGWVGEPCGGVYDEDTFGDGEEEDGELEGFEDERIVRLRHAQEQQRERVQLSGAGGMKMNVDDEEDEFKISAAIASRSRSRSRSISPSRPGTTRTNIQRPGSVTGGIKLEPVETSDFPDPDVMAMAMELDQQQGQDQDHPQVEHDRDHDISRANSPDDPEAGMPMSQGTTPLQSMDDSLSDEDMEPEGDDDGHFGHDDDEDLEDDNVSNLSSGRGAGSILSISTTSSRRTTGNASVATGRATAGGLSSLSSNASTLTVLPRTSSRMTRNNAGVRGEGSGSGGITNSSLVGDDHTHSQIATRTTRARSNLNQNQVTGRRK